MAGIIATLDRPPVLVGHSFGGMVAEKLLSMGVAAGAVAIDAAQIKGVLALPLSALRATAPVLRNPANKNRAISLTADQFAYGFGNAVDRAESDALYERWTIPAPGRPLFEAAAATFSPHSPAGVDTGAEDAERYAFNRRRAPATATQHAVASGCRGGRRRSCRAAW